MVGVSDFPSLKARGNSLLLELDYLTDSLEHRAQTELHENENIKEESLRSLKSLLKEVNDLHWQDEEEFLLAFLRARKYDVNRAFNHMKNFYNCLGKHGHFYYRGFDSFRRSIEDKTHHILPHRDSKGAFIIHFRFSQWNPEEISAEEHIICGTVGVLLALHSPVTQIAGFHLIADFKGFSMKHLLYTSPAVVWLFSELVQNVLPWRLQGIHVVNENILCSYILSMFKQLLSKKMRDRFHIHGKNMKKLHKFVNPNILPVTLGGDLPPFNNVDYCKWMETSSDIIEHMLSHGYKKYLIKEANSRNRS